MKENTMMSDNDIRKKFQSKLNNFESPVPLDGWERVEQSLATATHTRAAIRRRWYVGGVAAVLVLLVGSLLFMQYLATPTEKVLSEVVTSHPSATNQQEAVPQHDKKTPAAKAIEAGKKKNTQLFAAKRVLPIEQEFIHPSNPKEIMSDWLRSKNLNREEAQGKIHRSLVVLEATESAGQLINEKEHNNMIIRVGNDDRFADEEMSVGKGKSNLLLAVNGKGGLAGYQQTVNTPMTLRSTSLPPENKYLSDAANKFQSQSFSVKDNVSEMEHDQPVSVGITVSKFLTEDLSIETGLIYSYLRSRSRNTNNNFKVEEIQKLHYLGIPLNVNYNLFSLNRLDVYASVGGTIEKDIYGKFRKIKEGQAVNLINVAEDSGEREDTKISQKHLQVSVNAGLGVSYPLYDRLRLYGKVGGAYYFDAKNQYKTIYSDRKIVMDLNVGLRYEF